MLCDNCHEREASVFVTKIVDNDTTKQRLCEVCARHKALGEGWLQELTGEDAAALEGVPLEEIVMNLFSQAGQDTDSGDGGESGDNYSLAELAALHSQISGEKFGVEDAAEEDLDVTDFDGEFPADEDLADEIDELEEDAASEDDVQNTLAAMQAELEHSDALSFLEAENGGEASRDESGFDGAPFNPFSGGRGGEIAAVRCPKCETTWDRLRQDGRVGCANCYEVFGDHLNEVMNRLQNADQHIGKAPRAATKRRRRLEHLRARRDHRLAMLNARLAKAVTDEDYEEAAKLRDKIKIVASTIVSEE